jgi:hypothetical protein
MSLICFPLGITLSGCSNPPRVTISLHPRQYILLLAMPRFAQILILACEGIIVESSKNESPLHNLQLLLTCNFPCLKLIRSLELLLPHNWDDRYAAANRACKLRICL